SSPEPRNVRDEPFRVTRRLGQEQGAARIFSLCGPGRDNTISVATAYAYCDEGSRRWPRAGSGAALHGASPAAMTAGPRT
ncbi:MAG: hypothetical protein L0I24_14440, partial [Pseudonocardia sp.]|nr:hypothetical protein [Pseudonocardia sp.]